MSEKSILTYFAIFNQFCSFGMMDYFTRLEGLQIMFHQRYIENYKIEHSNTFLLHGFTNQQ
jgi:hypothetical protein